MLPEGLTFNADFVILMTFSARTGKGGMAKSVGPLDCLTPDSHSVGLD
jgi:hypothetical protein